MFRITRVVAIAAVTTFALAGASAASAAPARVRSHSVVGTLEKVDGQTLTVRTKKGSESLTLASNASIRQGAKTLAASDLSADTGSRVKVRYTDQNGQKEAQSVMISSAKRAVKTPAASANASSKKP